MQKKKLTPQFLIVDIPDQCPDLRYATRFSCPDAVSYFQASGKGHLLLPAMEFSRARKCVPRGIKVWSSADFPAAANQAAQLAEWLRRLGYRSVFVPPYFPIGLVERLRAVGIKVALQHAPLFPEREIKSELEIGHITATQRVMVAAMKYAVGLIAAARIGQNRILRQGGRILTSERIQKAVRNFLYERDCLAGKIIAAGGPESAGPHAEGSGPLRAEEPIVLDIFGWHGGHGYWGDLTRTVVRGRPGEKLRRMFLAVRAAHRACLKILRPELPASVAHRVTADTLVQHGFITRLGGPRPSGFLHSTGHGVGLAVHEQPSLRASASGCLRKNNVVTVEPGLYDPGIGGVRIEDTVAITAAGARILAPCPVWFGLDH